MKRLRAIVVAMLAGTLVLAASGRAVADDRLGPGQDRTQNLKGDAQKAGTNAELICSATAAPVPQYSPSNRTVHYGAHAVCNMVGTFTIEVKLWTVQGTGEREHAVLEATRNVPPTVDNHAGNSWFEPCLTGSARWQTSRTPTFNGIAFNPPTQWTTPLTLPCAPV